MSEETVGQRWIRFLRGYTPTTQNDSMITEKIANLAGRHKVEPIRFEHPLETPLFSLFFEADGRRKPRNFLKNVILTGMAGDGKTGLCYALWKKIFSIAPPKGENQSSRTLDWDGTPLTLSFMFDFSAFYSPQDNEQLPSEVVAYLEAFSKSILSEEAPEKLFVVAINDGQFAELWKRLPESSSARTLANLITTLHATHTQDSKERLSFFNLSLIATSKLFSQVYEALISRPEWDDCLAHSELKEFGPYSPLMRNLHALRSPEYKRRLFEIVSLCDGCKRHIPVRELLMWIANGLLGLKEVPNGVARLQDLRSCITAEDAYRGAFYGNLLGENLTKRQRDRFGIFRFLQALKLGNETISDLDELIIFGERIDKLNEAHAILVAPDPFQHRNPSLYYKLKDYTQGITEDYTKVLDVLAAERRRIFFSSNEDALAKALPGQSIWTTTVFHSAADYLKYFLSCEPSVPLEIMKKLVLGLNRVWTGLLAEDNEELFIAKGLNLSSAAISDVFVTSVRIIGNFGEQYISILKPGPESLVPRLKIIWLKEHPFFLFDLTLERFEFLMRVSKGIMPTAFSRECWEDIITLKTKLLRQMQRAGVQPKGIRTIETDPTGKLLSILIVG